MKNCYFFIILLLFISKYSFSQQITIHDLEYVGPTEFIPSDITAIHNYCDNQHAMPKIKTITDNGITEDVNDRWPQGTWQRGYHTWYGYDYWLDSLVHNKHWGCHPLAQMSSQMMHGYIRAHRLYGNIEYKNRMNAALDYISQQQLQNGSFIVWWYRNNKYEPTINDSNIMGNPEDVLETSTELRALVEAYWYKKEILNETGIQKYYRAIVKSANWLKNQNFDNTNSNYRAFAAGSLAQAYKITNDKLYLNKALSLCQWIINNQVVDNSIQDGMWLTGSEDTEGTVKVRHDTYIWYHMVIIRGLVETFEVIPFENVTFKSSVRQAIKKAINHVIIHRLGTGENFNKLKKLFTDVNGNVINSPYIIESEFSIETLTLLVYCSQKDIEGFSNQETLYLKYLLNSSH